MGVPVEGVARIGQLNRAVLALRRADLGGKRRAPGFRFAFGEGGRPGPGAGSVTGRLAAPVLIEGVEGVSREVDQDDSELFGSGSKSHAPGSLFGFVPFFGRRLVAPVTGPGIKAVGARARAFVVRASAPGDRKRESDEKKQRVAGS